MAGIDVSDLLLDPDFVDPVCVIRRTAIVDSTGKNNITEVPINSFASVQSLNTEALKRLPDGAQLNNYKTFFSKTPLLADSFGGYADIIVWRGQRFQVVNTMPFGNWGGGWYKADCVMEKPSL